MAARYFVLFLAAAVLVTLLVFASRSPQGLGLRRVFVSSDLSVTLEGNGSSWSRGHDLHTNVPIREGDWRLDALAAVNTSIHTKVLLVTYLRSGSTFTGDIFNHHPDVFYVFEPLFSLHKMLVDPKRWRETNAMGEGVMNVFLNCDFYSLDKLTLIQKHLSVSLATKGYYKCQMGKQDKLLCLHLLFEACRGRKVAVAKTVRFTMRQAAHLMARDPRIKVIHLVRDPRATVRSQMGLHYIENMSGAFRSFCQDVLRDLKTAEQMKSWFPGRVLSARYEDLAGDPQRWARVLLRFAGGLQMGEGLSRYLWNITSAGLPNNCAFCTRRANSTRTASRWRLRMNASVSRLVDEGCAEVYRRRGYLPLPSREALTDLGVPSFLEHDKVPGLWGAG